jgi:DNA-binding protein H-NS
MPNENGSSRLDRIEHALELLIDDHIQFREEHKQLLTAQVVLTDRVDKLAQIVSEEQKSTAERFKETDERLNALIKIVDGMIRNGPHPNAD